LNDTFTVTSQIFLPAKFHNFTISALFFIHKNKRVQFFYETRCIKGVWGRARSKVQEQSPRLGWSPRWRQSPLQLRVFCPFSYKKEPKV